MRKIAGAVALVLVGWFLLSTLADVLLRRTPEGRHRPPQDLDDFRQLLPRDAINPVYHPQFVSASDAALDPGELVIGIELDGVARAYPVGYLNFREMVNDRIGAVPFLVTW